MGILVLFFSQLAPVEDISRSKLLKPGAKSSRSRRAFHASTPSNNHSKCCGLPMPSPFNIKAP